MGTLRLLVLVVVVVKILAICYFQNQLDLCFSSVDLNWCFFKIISRIKQLPSKIFHLIVRDVLQLFISFKIKLVPLTNAHLKSEVTFQMPVVVLAYLVKTLAPYWHCLNPTVTLILTSICPMVPNRHSNTILTPVIPRKCDATQSDTFITNGYSVAISAH